MIGFFKKKRNANDSVSKMENEDNSFHIPQYIVGKDTNSIGKQEKLQYILKFIEQSENCVQSKIPNITEIENPLIDLEVISCVKTYIHEVKRQDEERKQLCEKAKKLVSSNGNLSELQDVWTELQSVQSRLKPKGIILNETSSQELDSIRAAIQEIGKSQRIQKVGGLEWKAVTEVSFPEELKYFKSATKPMIFRLMEFCFCVFSKTVLVFTLDGKFVTALKRDAFFVRTERDWERVYLNVKRNEYTAKFVAGDSKRVKIGDERFTWTYTNSDGSKDSGYINNPCIIYRYDTMEYGKILLCVADFSERFSFSSEKAVIAVEKAVAENAKYNVDRKSSNKSNFISLLRMLEPLSEQTRKIEETYAKLDVPQKKYCYIERG